MDSGTSRKKGKKGRKVGRNFKVAGKMMSVSRYRARHHIPAGSRKSNHAQGLCPKHN